MNVMQLKEFRQPIDQISAGIGNSYFQRERGDGPNRVNYPPPNLPITSGASTFDYVRASLTVRWLGAINLNIAQIPTQIMTNSRRATIDDRTENQ